ncbi:hypothetical protein J6TS2_48870 [Heyndrickxia sporothermodurans]|nr:hypothetical protein J6TS2_48870 [Heyndrickxia sporothermodurans]
MGGSSSQGGNSSPSIFSLLFKSSDSERGILGNILGGIRDYKTYILGFADKVAQAGAAGYAGFGFTDKGNSRYGVTGKNQLDNKIANWFYERYRGYKFNGEETAFGPQSRHIGSARQEAFFKSKRIGNIGNSVKGALNESWNIFSKDFYKAKNMVKLNGPVNVVLSSVNNLIDYSKWGSKSKLGYASTDFAADLTVDTAIGVGSTALGALASSAAAGAIAGSTVPVVGTIVGAGVGLLVGGVTTYLINGTATGRRLKKYVRDGVKYVYDGVVSGVKSASKVVTKKVKDIGKGVSSAFKKLGGLFGG